MNVASLELCTELYGLSGWEANHEWGFIAAHAETDPEPYEIDNGEPVCPAYDLGYLLRQLENIEETIILRYNNPARMGAVALPQWNGQYTVATARMQQGDYPIGDTPEDATAKLAIELFKQGILTKEKPDEQ